MSQPPYSPDMAPYDFFLFPKIKRILKGRRSTAIDDIKSASLKELKAIETRKYHRGASVPKQIWPLPGTKYHCQRTKNGDFRQLTLVQ